MEKELQLRSEKVRKIIGQVPSVFLRYGTTILFLTLVILFFISAFIPYTKTIDSSVLIKKDDLGIFHFSAIIPEHIIVDRTKLEVVKLSPEAGWPFDEIFLIDSISSKLNLSSIGENNWYDATLNPRSDISDKIQIEGEVVLPSKIIFKQQTVLKWIIENFLSFRQ